MSSYVRQWKIGSTALWRGPFGNLPYSPNKVSSEICSETSVLGKVGRQRTCISGSQGLRRSVYSSQTVPHCQAHWHKATNMIDICTYMYVHILLSQSCSLMSHSYLTPCLLIHCHGQHKAKYAHAHSSYY